jgi:hypothetical protein
MADNPGRFVIIDGVQYSKERARRAGLIDENDKLTEKASGGPVTPTGKPSSNRARSAGSTRRKAADAAEVEPDDEDDQES